MRQARCSPAAAVHSHHDGPRERCRGRTRMRASSSSRCRDRTPPRWCSTEASLPWRPSIPPACPPCLFVCCKASHLSLPYNCCLAQPPQSHSEECPVYRLSGQTESAAKGALRQDKTESSLFVNICGSPAQCRGRATTANQTEAAALAGARGSHSFPLVV